MWITAIAIFVGIICIGWFYIKRCYSYWSFRGIRGPKPTPLLGHTTNMLSGEPWKFVENNYKKHKQEKFFGVYEMMKPSLFVCDPELIKRVFVKDFDHFVDRRTVQLPEKDQYMNDMLFIVGGEKWKKMRSILSPTFSSGKMKHMYNTIFELTKKFNLESEKDLANFNSKDMFGRFAIEVISSCAFGIKTNSIIEKNCPFSEKADELFTTSFKKSVVTILIMYLPKLAETFGISFEDDVSRFFKNICTETINQRKKVDEYRGDFLDILMEEQKKQNERNDPDEYKITQNTLIAQSILFLITGYDTTASCLTVTSYYLAKHQEYQDRLREELLGIVDEDGKLDYYKLMEAKYLDACISEALRLIPPLSFIERTCVKDYQFPDTDVKVLKDMMVLIPVWGFHRDPEFWEDPDEYNPDRFLPESKSPSTNFAYMPFGLGPRNCIAMRFALMEVKLCLAKFVLNFKLNLAPGHEELKIVVGNGNVRTAPDSVVLALDKIL